MTTQTPYRNNMDAVIKEIPQVVEPNEYGDDTSYWFKPLKEYLPNKLCWTGNGGHPYLLAIEHYEYGYCPEDFGKHTREDMMKAIVWANRLGRCYDVQSQEHYDKLLSNLYRHRLDNLQPVRFYEY